MSAQNNVLILSFFPEDRLNLIALAACILMAADQNLSPRDAVGDVLQVYDYARRGAGQE